MFENLDINRNSLESKYFYQYFVQYWCTAWKEMLHWNWAQTVNFFDSCFCFNIYIMVMHHMESYHLYWKWRAQIICIFNSYFCCADFILNYSFCLLPFLFCCVRNFCVNVNNEQTNLLTLLLTWFNLLLAWISNYIHYKVWDDITYQLSNFNSGVV